MVNVVRLMPPKPPGPPVTLINDCCLNAIQSIESGIVDLVLCDPPYGTTACKWDSVIPLQSMWQHLLRIAKPNAAIVLTASQPFTTMLIGSNMGMFKYCWVWDKAKPGAIGIAKYQPLRYSEDVVVFYRHTALYNPQMVPRDTIKSSRNYSHSEINPLGNMEENKEYTEKYPSNIIRVSNASQKDRLHPTQKPVALMEYLIKTYSNEGDTVLDFAMGSGTTGVACKNLNRKFIGIEKDLEYFRIASERIDKA